MSDWSVYILRCADGTLYTGVARDVEKRVDEHNHNNRLAARYTRGRRPVSLVYREDGFERGDALRREIALKRLSRKQKESVINVKNK